MRWLQQIADRFPVRKSAEQKQAFLKYAAAAARKMGYAAHVEENGRHRNLVMGQPETAEVLFTAHYDTPANKLIPSPIIPRNLPLFLLCQLATVLLLFAVSFGAGYLSYLITREPRLTLIVFLLCYFGLLLLLTAGPANKHNMNCNTSGVAAVLELMEQLPPEVRDQAAFILFDNGETGRLGSRAYATRHQQIKKRTLILNLDCVGVGDHLLFMVKNYARATFAYRFLEESFADAEQLKTHWFPSSGCTFVSDHASFRCGVNVTACKRKKGIGFYTPHIHTRRDTEADARNIEELARCLVTFVKSVAAN